MSTRSYIGLESTDGSIQGIYCHFDGYIEHNGLLLNDYYQDVNKVKSLIKLGHISTLGINIGHKTDFEKPDVEHDEQCIAYHRDGGEDLEIWEFKNRSKLNEEYYDMGVDFVYLYSETDRKWFIKQGFEYNDLESEIKRLSESKDSNINKYRLRFNLVENPIKSKTPVCDNKTLTADTKTEFIKQTTNIFTDFLNEKGIALTKGEDELMKKFDELIHEWNLI